MKITRERISFTFDPRDMLLSLEKSWLEQSLRERKKKKRQTEEEVERQFKEGTGMDFIGSTRAAKNRTRWEGTVANSSGVPRRPSKVME